MPAVTTFEDEFMTWLASAASLILGTSLFRNMMGDRVNTGVLVTFSGGPPPDGQATRFEPVIHVLARAADRSTAASQIGAIYDLLHHQRSGAHLIQLTNWSIRSLRATGQPSWAGQDENNRDAYTCAFTGHVFAR